jgi:hypothetical protein
VTVNDSATFVTALGVRYAATFHQLQEKAERNPPPPGAAPEPDVIVRTVPAATLDAAVPEFELPAVEAVEKLMIEEPAVHVPVDAFTV